jgi:hypothetical protein
MTQEQDGVYVLEWELHQRQGICRELGVTEAEDRVGGGTCR